MDIKSRSYGYSIILFFTLFIAPVFLYGMEPDKTERCFEASFNYESQGNYTASLDSILQVLRRERGDYDATLRAGWLYYLMGNYQMAMDYYNKAVSIAPEAIEPKLGLMLPLMASKRWKQAEKTSREIIKVDSRNYLANSRLAYILFSQSRYEEAENQYSRVIRWYPGDIDMRLGLAWTYLRMGREKEAERYFKTVLKVRRNNPNALLGIKTIEKNRK